MLLQENEENPEKSTRRSSNKSKNIRGGVTRKRRKISNLTREIGLGHGGALNARIKGFVRPILTDGNFCF